MNVEISFVSAFTKNNEGGNPAAIVLDADRFSHAQKQLIAKKLGLSETAFVGRSDMADFKMDFFTPVKQIAHCGHATIASFSYLRQIGMIGDINSSSKETIDGRKEIVFTDGEAYMEQKSPSFSSPEPKDEPMIFESLGLSKNKNNSLSIVDTGNRFLILQLKNEKELAGLVPDHEMISGISEKYGLIGYYVFCKSRVPGIDATSRMFAPLYGIPEESATGMAAGPLACYLYQFDEKKNSIFIEQGRFMKPASPSLIKVKLVTEGGMIRSVYAGGAATLIGKELIEVE